MTTNRLVIGVASGKGGVGKTTTAVNLAACLASQGKDTLLLDGDLGLSNAQILLGCSPQYTFADVLSGQKTVEEVLITGPHGLKLLPGASGVSQLATLSQAEVRGLVNSVSQLPPCDVLIVDAAAGISHNVTLLLQACDHQIVIVENEPSSIADAYGIIKVLAQELGLSQSLHVLPNRVSSHREGESIHRLLNDVSMKFLDVSVNYLSSIREDNKVVQAARAGIPVIDFAPSSLVASDVRTLAKKVLELPSASRASGGIQFFMEQLADQAGERR